MYQLFCRKIARLFKSFGKSNMARKDNKQAKEKKKERKLLEMKMNAGVANVKRANSQENPISSLPSFATFSKNGENIQLETRRVKELDKETREWAFKLLEKNMKEMYVASNWGWNETNKRLEMEEDTAWYLIARNVEEEKNVAFCHFRYYSPVISVER